MVQGKTEDYDNYNFTVTSSYNIIIWQPNEICKTATTKRKGIAMLDLPHKYKLDFKQFLKLSLKLNKYVYIISFPIHKMFSFLHQYANQPGHTK